MVKVINKLKENYGPFKDQDTFERAKSKWNNSTKEVNDKYFQDFKEDLIEAVSQVFTDYYMSHGCRYLGKQAVEIIDNVFKNSFEEPFTFADLIDNEDDVDEYDYYERKNESLNSSNKQENNKKIVEGYGPYSSRDEYESALMDWKDKDSDTNIQHYNDFLSELKTLFRKEFFDKDFPDDLGMLYTYYYSQYGCNYDREEAEEYIKEAEDKVRMGQRNLQEIENREFLPGA